MSKSKNNQQNRQQYFRSLAVLVDAISYSLQEAYKRRKDDDVLIDQRLEDALQKSHILKKRVLELFLAKKD